MKILPTFFSSKVVTKETMAFFNILANESINAARESIHEGNVIALPTDTVYGLACNANNSVAVQKLYAIKGRNQIKPVAICVADLKSVKLYGNAEHLSDELLNSLLPGPITIVLEKSNFLSCPHLNPGISKIGIRIPKFKFIRELCKKLNYPLALTSANLSNQPSSLSIKEFQTLWPQLGGVFDGGLLGLNESSRSASTVIDLSIPGKYKIIRNGIAVDETVKIMDKFNIKSINLI